MLSRLPPKERLLTTYNCRHKKGRRLLRACRSTDAQELDQTSKDGAHDRIECTGVPLTRRGYLKGAVDRISSGNKNGEMKKADTGVIVVYVILVLAVVALLFFIINWLRCMRRRHRYVDNEEEMEEVPDNSI